MHKTIATFITGIFAILLMEIPSAKAQSLPANSKADSVKSVGQAYPIPMANSNWNHLAARYDVNIDLGKMPLAGAFSIRMKRDSILWFSASAAVLGIQIAKGIITQDTAKIQDLYNKKYYCIPTSQLTDLLGTPLGLKQLQALFLGHALVDTGTLKFVKQGYQSYESPIGDSEFSILTVLMNATQTIEKSLIASPTKPNTSCSIGNVNFEKRENTNLPTRIEVKLKDEENTAQLDFSLKTARFDAIPSYPFNVPTGYETINTLGGNKPK